MIHYLKQARPLAGILALVVGLTLVTPPAFAAEAQTSVLVAPAQPTLAAAAAAKVEAMPAAALAQAVTATPPTSGKPFLKTGKGAVAMVLMASVLGYMGYSFSHDRVKSPAK